MVGQGVEESLQRWGRGMGRWGGLRNSPNTVALITRARAAMPPSVFVAVADPVGAGFVESMARPGGNLSLVHSALTSPQPSPPRLPPVSSLRPPLPFTSDRPLPFALCRSIGIGSAESSWASLSAESSSGDKLTWTISLTILVIGLLSGPLCVERLPGLVAELLCVARICRSRRPNELWRQDRRAVSAGRHLCGAGPQRREAGRPRAA
jgi:hypothetical protein